MKRLVVLFLAMLLPVSGFCMLKKPNVELEAGDPNMKSVVQLGESYRTIVFGGVRFIENSGTLVSFGIGSPIAGSNVYLFNYTDVGRYGSISTEAAYLFTPAARLYVGPLAGPNVDWVGQSAVADPITYLTGAAGAVVGYNFSGNWGAWGYGKYNFSFAGDTKYQAGYLVGVGLYCGW